MKRKIDGVITVEAAVVMPLFIGVLLSMIIAGMYMHDICVAKQITSEGIDKLVLAIYKEYDISSDMIDYEKRMDRNIILHSAGVLTGNIVSDSSNDCQRKVKKSLYSKIDENMFICDVKSVNIKMKGGKTEIDTTLCNRLNNGVMEWIWLPGKSKKVTVTKYAVDECELIRLTSVVADG